MARNQKTFRLVLTISLLFVLFSPSAFLVGQVKADDGIEINVALIKSDSLPDYDISLSLDSRINLIIYDAANISQLDNDLPNMNVTFIADFNVLTADQVDKIVSNVSAGMGLFFQPNTETETYSINAIQNLEKILPLDIKYDATGLPEAVPTDEFGNIGIKINESVGKDHPVLDNIGFTSMPQLLYAGNSTAHANASILLSTINDEPVLAESVYYDGKVFTMTSLLKTDYNEHLADWPYFNYLMYFLSFYLAGYSVENIDSYNSWSYSPLPHGEVKIIVLTIIIAITLFTIVLFFYMKKKSRESELEVQPPTRAELLVSERVKKEKIEAASSQAGAGRKIEQQTDEENTDNQDFDVEIEWAEIGYHKPLAGFSIMFYLSLALVLPLIIVVMYIVPTFILTDPSQLGISFVTGNIFSAVFIAGDFGLAQAFDKFVSENYVKDPKQALKYVQFFIWFQMLSGLVQTGVIAIIGLYIIPQTAALAFMSYQFVAKAFIQWPGTGYLFTHSMKALQRTDKEQLVNLLAIVFFDVGGMAVFTSIFLALGQNDPTIGIVIGGSLGITVAEVFKTFGLLILSGTVFAKMDKRFSIWDMFRVDFDIELVKRTLWFGLKSMASNVILLTGNFIVTIYIMLNMQSYTTYSAFIGSATFILYPVTFMVILYESALPTTAEAYGNDCKVLTQAYVSFGWKYFATFGILVWASFFFFLNPLLTEILPPLYKEMGFFLGWYSLTRIIMGLGDFSKLFLIAIDKVDKYLLFVTIEQILRIVILVSLMDIIPRPELLLIFGELPGAILKSFLTWWYTHRKVLPVKINLWQTVIAPILSVTVYVIIGSIILMIYRGIIANHEALIPTIICSFVIFTGLTMTVYPFALALLGAWDKETMRQLQFSTQHSGPSKPFGLLFLKITKFGNKISPLYDKHPIDYESAQDEVKLLTEMKTNSR